MFKVEVRARKWSWCARMMTCGVVQGSQHEVLHDKDRDVVIGRIKDWILERSVQ
jgi:alpha-beta hydrolase superfamily lysophospholipase